MNKAFKRIVNVIGTVFVSVVIVVGIYSFKLKSEPDKMSVVETKEVVQNVYAINDSFVNMFLVKDNENYVAIDAGNDIKVIASELNKLNINPDKVSAIMLTHSDGDHVGALKLFKNAKIYLSKEEEQMINGKTARMLNKYNKIDSKSYTLVNDKQTIHIGKIRIRGILTPGHTPGSISYLVNDSWLFVGDAFGLKDGKIDKPNKVYTMDMKTAILSFNKITHLPKAEFIFTAHSGYTGDYKNAVNIKLE